MSQMGRVLIILVIILITCNIMECTKKVVFLDSGNTCRSPTLMYLAKYLAKTHKLHNDEDKDWFSKVRDGAKAHKVRKDKEEDAHWFSNVEFESAAYDKNVEPVTSGNRENQDKGLSEETYKMLIRGGYYTADELPYRQPQKVSKELFPAADAENTHFYVICSGLTEDMCQENIDETLKLLADPTGEIYKHVNVFGLIPDPFNGATVDGLAVAKPVAYSAMFARAYRLLLHYLQNGNREWDLTDNKFGKAKRRPGASEPLWKSEWRGSGEARYRSDLKIFNKRYKDMTNSKYNGAACTRKWGLGSECKEGCKCGHISHKCRARALKTCPGRGGSNVYNHGIYAKLMPDEAFVSAHFEDYGDYQTIENGLEEQEINEVIRLLKKNRHFS